MSPLRIGGIVTAGAGVIAMVAGAIVGAGAQSDGKNAKAMCVNNVCPSSLQPTINSINSRQNAANVLLVGGGVLAAGGVVMILLGKNKTATTTSWNDVPEFNLGVTASPFGGGLQLSGSF